jgi:hypothetical protein
VSGGVGDGASESARPPRFVRTLSLVFHVPTVALRPLVMYLQTLRDALNGTPSYQNSRKAE